MYLRIKFNHEKNALVVNNSRPKQKNEVEGYIILVFNFNWTSWPLTYLCTTAGDNALTTSKWNIGTLFTLEGGILSTKVINVIMIIIIK